MRRHRKRSIMEALEINPGIDSRALGDELNMDPSAVTQWVHHNLENVRIERGPKRAKFFLEVL